MTELRLRIEGREAESVAEAVAGAVEAELGEAPRRQAMGRRPGGDERADPVAVAALVLAIPGAVLQAMDLAERVKLREKVARLLQRIRTAAGPNAHVRVETREGLKSLGQVTVDDLLDAAGA